MTSTNDDSMAPIRPTVTGKTTTKPVARLCQKCGKLILSGSGKPILDGDGYHDLCRPTSLVFSEASAPPGASHPVRTELLDIIRWTDRNSTRSRQIAVGPSELGTSCERRLAMRMAGLSTVNRTSDPWPAIVGIAMHSWLQTAVERWNTHLGRQRYLTEIKVIVDQIIKGTSDLYDTDRCTVVDWKSMGLEKAASLDKGGPPWGYYIQAQTYGLGLVRAGYRVDQIGLMFLPRAGRLRDARYYEWPFDPTVAHDAIERMYRIGRETIELQRIWGEDIWPMIPAAPEADRGLCGWCPFYRRPQDGDTVASATGCPGR